MELSIFNILLILVLIASIGIIIFLYQQNKKHKEISDLKIKELMKEKNNSTLSEKDAIEKASKIAKDIIIEAEKKSIEIESKIQEDAKKLREQLKTQEINILEREKNLIERSKIIDEKYKQIEEKEAEISKIKNEITQIKQNLLQKLEQISNLTKNEAEELLKKEIESNLKSWTVKKIKEYEQELKIKSDEISKEILTESMISAMTDYVAETTTTIIEIPEEEVKSRIIGKQGRNIRIFEKLTGADLIIDDTPNIITVSCFDPIRREVASIALKKLVADGRINPGSIEETIEKVKKDILKEIKKTGEEMVFEAGFTDIPNEIIMLLGRFKYRFSYGQNLVKHTLEMVKIGEYIARELKADISTTKLACLLHDIGKVVPEEGKQHHHISAEIARKFFPKNDKLINAIEAHHYDIESKYIESEIVRIADAISGSRPGARRDSYEDHIKRVRAIEEIANKYKGVKEAYAIKAGKELRIILEPENTKDEDTSVIAYNVAREIEKTQNYPGIITVNVIRETRSTEEAK